MSKLNSPITKSIRNILYTTEAYDYFLQRIIGIEKDNAIYNALHFNCIHSIPDFLSIDMDDITLLDFRDDKDSVRVLNHRNQGHIHAIQAFVRYLARDEKVDDLTSITKDNFKDFFCNIYLPPNDFGDYCFDNYYPDDISAQSFAK